MDVVSEVQVRLPRTYDVARLEQDLAAVRHIELARQPGPYHDGEWKGISLYAQGGKQGAHPGYAGLDAYAPTEALQCTPYMKEILDGLLCPKKVVRLLTLPPGAAIGEHHDAWANFLCGALRLHVPIVTHPEVEFVIDGERCRWEAGELWYGDFSLPHRVVNRSSIVRVHLVIDVEINDFVLGLFPEPFIRRKMAQGDGIAMVKPLLVGRDGELGRFVCDFTVPPEVMPLFGGGKKMSSFGAGARGAVRASGSKLLALLDDQPSFALERVGETTFDIVGLSAGCSFEFSLAEGEVTGLTLVLRGLPEDLYAAQLGYPQGPMIPRREVPFPLA